LGFFVDVIMGLCLCVFESHHQALDASVIGHFFVSSFCWKLGYNESLEGFIDFLMILVTKLWPKNTKEIPTNPLGNMQKICFFFAVILAPGTLESRSRALKTHVLAYFPIKP